MKLNELTLKERLLLARRAESRCAECLTVMADRVRPVDPNLARGLWDMAADEEDHGALLARYDGTTPWPLVWRLNEPAIEDLLREYLPNLWCGDPEAPADPEAVRRRTESIEEESVRFYRALAEDVRDPAAYDLFMELALSEAAHGLD